MANYKQRKNSFRIIIFGFAVIILTGTLLLMLPISSVTREWTSFTDSLFTSTSAVCVTGLVVRDTGYLEVVLSREKMQIFTFIITLKQR